MSNVRCPEFPKPEDGRGWILENDVLEQQWTNGNIFNHPLRSSTYLIKLNMGILIRILVGTMSQRTVVILPVFFETGNEECQLKLYP